MTNHQYDKCVSKLRNFFRVLNYVEISVQNRLSILAACEDPETISTFVFNGQSWPLPQTGQMWLERELLLNPEYKGVYCISTSYRNEPNPILGRHDLIFPMFEFEGRGNVENLIDLECDLMDHFNISLNELHYKMSYQELCVIYDTSELLPKHESLIQQDFGNIFIIDFPESSSPFWNMRRNDNGTSRKVDIILNGMETIGSAERETDTYKMKENFHSISNGKYAGLLYRHFGEERVNKELEDYLSLPMTIRFGGGIGLTRLARIYEMV